MDCLELAEEQPHIHTPCMEVICPTQHKANSSGLEVAPWTYRGLSRSTKVHREDPEKACACHLICWLLWNLCSPVHGHSNGGKPHQRTAEQESPPSNCASLVHLWVYALWDVMQIFRENHTHSSVANLGSVRYTQRINQSAVNKFKLNTPDLQSRNSQLQ